MRFELELEVEDWYGFQNYLAKKIPSKNKFKANGFWINVIIWAVIAIVAMSLYENIGFFHWQTGVFVFSFLVLIIFYAYYYTWRYKKACEPLPEGVFCGKHIFEFGENGISSSGAGYNSYHSWDLVKELDRKDGFIFVFLDSAYAFILPEKKLEDPEKIYEYLLSKIEM